MPPGSETIRARDRGAWRLWLERHAEISSTIWLVLAKRGATTTTLTYEEAVEEALCFGWIDSTANAVDGETYKIRMARRKPGSGWSAVNKRRIQRLLAEGRMAAPGLAAIEAAKTDGSWSRLDASHSLDVPKDLSRALAKHPNAERHFEGFPPSARRVILQWIDAAKKPETRAKRIEETARLANQNIRANQPPRQG